MWWRRQPVNEHRWVVLDLETSGLDVVHDRLLSIAAVAVHRVGSHWELRADDAFEVVLRQEDPAISSRSNVLLHGIGWQSQREGTPGDEALDAFNVWLEDSPWMGYHAPFDRAILKAQSRREGSAMPGQAWMDLRDLAPLMGVASLQPGLDECCAAAGIEVAQRHNAMADAWATAELWLYVWPMLHARSCSSWKQVSRLASQMRWLRR